jgi:hypothetical protein
LTFLGVAVAFTTIAVLLFAFRAFEFVFTVVVVSHAPIAKADVNTAVA